MFFDYGEYLVLQRQKPLERNVLLSFLLRRCRRCDWRFAFNTLMSNYCGFRDGLRVPLVRRAINFPTHPFQHFPMSIFRRDGVGRPGCGVGPVESNATFTAAAI